MEGEVGRVDRASARLASAHAACTLTVRVWEVRVWRMAVWQSIRKLTSYEERGVG